MKADASRVDFESRAASSVLYNAAGATFELRKPFFILFSSRWLVFILCYFYFTLIFIYLFIYFFLVEAIYYFKWHCFYNIDRLPWKKILQFPTRIFSFSLSLSLLLVHHDNETMIIRFKWHTLASVVLFFLLRLFFLISSLIFQLHVYSFSLYTHARTHARISFSFGTFVPIKDI